MCPLHLAEKGRANYFFFASQPNSKSVISLFRPSRPAARDTPFRQERARFDPWHPVVGVVGHGYKDGTHACEEILRARPVLALEPLTVKCLKTNVRSP